VTACNAPAGAPFAAGSVLVVRVGDGSSALTGALAPLALEEVAASAAGALLQTVSTTLAAAGNDPTLGALTRSANGQFAVLVGVSGVGPGLPAGAAAPFFGPFSTRSIARVAADGSVDASTQLPVAAYDGLLRGACSLNGSGYFLVGNSSGTALAGNSSGVAFVPHGVAGVAASAAVTSLWSATTDFSACGAFGSKLFLARAVPGAPLTGGVFLSSASSSGAGSAPLSVTSLAGGGLIMMPGMPSYFATTVVASASGQVVFLSDLQSAGPPAPPNPSVWRSSDGGATFSAFLTNRVVTGLALSLDESTLFFATPVALYSVSSACSPLPCNTVTLKRYAPLGTEYRGVAISPCPAGTSGFACTPCARGSFATAGGQAQCTACPAFATTPAAGASSLAQCACAAGFYATSTSPLACAACPSDANSTGGTSSCTCNDVWAVWQEATNTCFLAPSPTSSPSATATISVTASASVTPTVSKTSTSSLTASVSVTPTVSLSPTPSRSPSISVTASITPTPSQSPSPTSVPNVLLLFSLAISSPTDNLRPADIASSATVLAAIVSGFSTLLRVAPEAVFITNITDVATGAFVVPQRAAAGAARILAPAAGSLGVSVSVAIDLGKTPTQSQVSQLTSVLAAVTPSSIGSPIASITAAVRTATQVPRFATAFTPASIAVANSPFNMPAAAAPVAADQSAAASGALGGGIGGVAGALTLIFCGIWSWRSYSKVRHVPPSPAPSPDSLPERAPSARPSRNCSTPCACDSLPSLAARAAYPTLPSAAQEAALLQGPRGRAPQGARRHL
jgi:hypothetical protein